MKEFLSQKKVRYAFEDITSGMRPLKSFLKIRDHNDSHKEPREIGSVGIPTLLVDDKTYLVNEDNIEMLFSELNLGE